MTSSTTKSKRRSTKIKTGALYLFIFLTSTSIAEMTTLSNMSPQTKNGTDQPNVVTTRIGDIACHVREVPDTEPIIFLHGVYFDHRMWDALADQFADRTTIAVDMPMHGASQAVSTDWTLDDCAAMLVDILDDFGAERCIAVGHSWGSMTILRAAAAHPERFSAVGLCNLPLEAGGFGAKLQFGFQHLMLPFRAFYAEQVAKAMFGKEHRAAHPEDVDYLTHSMSALSNGALRHTDRTVIMNADDGWAYLEKLEVPAIALHGEDDYVPTPDGIETVIVPGQHVSPLEQPEAVASLIARLVERSL